MRQRFTWTGRIAPLRWSTSVRHWLDNTSPGSWMGRGSLNMPWRAPIAKPHDMWLFVCGFEKFQVYKGRILTLDEAAHQGSVRSHHGRDASCCIRWKCMEHTMLHSDGVQPVMGCATQGRCTTSKQSS
ncbi:hypothetical protein ISCGN_022614 [Ixodes scapularis]